MSKAPRNTNQFNSSTKVLAAVVCLALLLSTTPLVTANNVKSESWNWLALFSQGHQSEPRWEAPEGVFPNLDEMRRTTDDRRRYGVDEPSIPDPIPSTRRRWRRGSQAAQPSGNVEVNFNALIALASTASDTGIPWLISREAESISTLPTRLSFSSAKDYAPDHKAAAEPAGIGASVALSPQSPSNFAMARLAPQNRTGTPGVDLLSKNFNWSLGLIGLRGRSGLDLGLSLTYNSRVWTKSGDYYLDFDLDEGTPAPGFRLGFPVVQGLYYNDQASAYFYMLITPAGQRIELRRLGTSNVYQTVDATYAQLTDYGSYFIFRADGAQLKFVSANGEYRCTEVKDRNGNYLTIAYNSSGDISTVTDTLARVLTFSYDGNSNLLKITQVWGIKSRSWATFGYGERYVGNNFYPLVSYGPIDTYINVLTQVGLPDGSRYNFEYNNYYGMVSEIRHHAKDGHERRRTTYTYSASGSDCPTVSAQREWAENWNGDVNGTYAANEEAVTNFGVDGSACTMTLPNGVIDKQFYGTGWQAGLITQTETWSEGLRRKWTTYAWTQDNTGVSYLLNPRLIETNVNDVEGNLRRTTISYGPYEQYSLPYLVREYAGPNGTIPIRETYTDYNLGQAYLDRRIIGLVSWVHVSDTAQWLTKITYGYDDPTKIEALPAAATRHDPSFNTSFLSRGNVTSVSRWDVTDINNPAKELKTKISYNITGSVIRTTDPADHSQTVSYNDSFSDNQNGRNTFAYPTTATDADGFSSYVQYNFDFAAVTRTQGPPPAGQSQGAIVTMAYDAAGRNQWIVNQNNGAWKYTTYSDRGDAVMSQETINVPPSYWSLTVVDGANRVRALGGDHPGSNGGYSAVFTDYDVMGRVWQQTNPTETTGGWAPAGDDQLAGWIYTYQTYDWQGRPLVTTHPSITANSSETTTTELSYGGCGCAGGQVVTQLDEGTLDGGEPKRREKKIYSDVLGRPVKTEVRNWQGGIPYSTTVNTYNARDQITQVRQYAGAEGSGSYQDTILNYDGYGRLKTKHVPEQDTGTATTWDYYPDDTIQKVTDARGASQTLTYNPRHLPTNISYAAPPSIPATGPVSFGYDAAGNRTSMTDSSGFSSYVYDQLSRRTSETRYFNYTGKSYVLSYGYNLAGDVTIITDSFSGQVTYSLNHLGRVTGITGTGTVIGNYASSLTYRAWGARKHITYGNSMTSEIGYNSRLLPKSFNVAGANPAYGPATPMNSDFQYYSDGRLKSARDLVDNKFDRAYSYDHVGRLREAYTNQQARDFLAGTSSGWDFGPYRESFSFDANDNMTSRVGRFWSQPTDTLNINFNNNNRNTDPSWHYDAEGNLLSADGESYVYDAAGRLVHVPAPSHYRLYYDGDGNIVRRVEGDYMGHELKSYYNVQSTVMGGRLIIQDSVVLGYQDQALIYQSNFFRRFVYAEGELIAKEYKDYNPIFDPSSEWVHQNPVTGSIRGSSQYTAPAGDQRELDAGGINVGLSDPAENPPPSGGGSPTLDPEMAGACNINGIQFNCDFPLLLLGNSAIRCPTIGCSITVMFGNQLTLAFFNRMADGYEGFMPMNARYTGKGNFTYAGRPGTVAAARRSSGYLEDTDFRLLNRTGNNELFLARTSESFSQDPSRLDPNLIKREHAFADAETVLLLDRTCRNFFRKLGNKLRALTDVRADLRAFARSATYDPKLQADASTLNQAQNRGASIKLSDYFFSDETQRIYTWNPTLKQWEDDYGLVGRQHRAATILHEFAHALGLIPRDGRTADPTGQQSEKNDQTIYDNCYKGLHRLPLRN